MNPILAAWLMLIQRDGYVIMSRGGRIGADRDADFAEWTEADRQQWSRLRIETGWRLG